MKSKTMVDAEKLKLHARQKSPYPTDPVDARLNANEAAETDAAANAMITVDEKPLAGAGGELATPRSVRTGGTHQRTRTGSMSSPNRDRADQVIKRIKVNQRIKVIKRIKRCSPSRCSSGTLASALSAPIRDQAGGQCGGGGLSADSSCTVVCPRPNSCCSVSAMSARSLGSFSSRGSTTR